MSYAYTTRTTTSAAADWISEAIILNDLQGFAIQVDFTGTDVAGTLILEAQVESTMGWISVAGSSQAITNSTGHMWSASAQQYRAVRVNWDYTSGTGNMTVRTFIKETPVRTS